MPRELRPVNPRPLSEVEEHTLRSLLDRRSQTLPEAQAARDKERALERKLREKSDRLAAREAALSRRLAELRIDLDVVTGQLYQLASSGTAFRFANEGLQKLAEIIPTQSYFNTSHDTMDRDALMLIGQIALSLHKQATKPKGRPLREKMQGVDISIGQDAPNAGGPSDGRAELAARIIQAGRRRRGEE